MSNEAVREFKASWLPNITEAGLDRLIDLLDKGSPLLIQGCFTRALPTGCLATHAGWHHPRTAHLMLDAGITWLHHVAGLNPATSRVIREWDGCGSESWAVRCELLDLLRQERAARRAAPAGSAVHAELVGV
jgi:hypothetical protein